MKTNKIAILVFILLVLSINVSAIGITPGRKTVNFEPNAVDDVTLTVLNTENKEFEAAVYVTGELKEYVQLSESSIKFNSGEEKKTISYKVSLPESFEKPGLHSAEIVVRELSPQGAGETVVSTMVAVVSQLHVMVPYPGKYAEADIYFAETRVGEPVKFFVRINNLGKESIVSAEAAITIFNAYDNKEAAKIETDGQPVAAGSRKELTAVLKESLDPGVYHAVAVVNYDGKEAKAENDFIITGFLLKPLDISVRDFKLGEIAKFNILVENIGSREVKGAYSKILLDDGTGQSIADVKSSSIDIDPKMKEEMSSYWETTGVKEGTYKGKLVLAYEDKSDEKDIRTTVSKDSIKTEILGITGFAISETPGAVTKKTPWLAILVVLLLVINIGWLIYVKKKK